MVKALAKYRRFYCAVHCLNVVSGPIFSVKLSEVDIFGSKGSELLHNVEDLVTRAARYSDLSPFRRFDRAFCDIKSRLCDRSQNRRLESKFGDFSGDFQKPWGNESKTQQISIKPVLHYQRTVHTIIVVSYRKALNEAVPPPASPPRE